MKAEVKQLKRIFIFDGIEYDDVNPEYSPKEVVKTYAMLNPKLALYANGNAKFQKKEEDKIYYEAVKTVSEKG